MVNGLAEPPLCLSQAGGVALRERLKQEVYKVIKAMQAQSPKQSGSAFHNPVPLLSWMMQTTEGTDKGRLDVNGSRKVRSGTGKKVMEKMVPEKTDAGLQSCVRQP